MKTGHCSLGSNHIHTSSDEEAPHRSVLAVTVSDADAGPPLQGVPRIEGRAQDPVGGGRKAQKKRRVEREEPLFPRRPPFMGVHGR